MQEMNLIRLSQPDYPAIGGVAMLTAQNSRSTAPIVVAVQDDHALPLHSPAEHNPLGAGEKGGSEDEILYARGCGRKRGVAVREGFMRMFTICN